MQRGTSQGWEAPHSFPKGAGSGGYHDCRVSQPGVAHQKNKREQRFAFCSGLDFTFGYSGSIVPAAAGVERRSAALTSVRLPLLLEVTTWMLKISLPSGSAGRARRTTGF